MIVADNNFLAGTHEHEWDFSLLSGLQGEPPYCPGLWRQIVLVPGAPSEAWKDARLQTSSLGCRDLDSSSNNSYTCVPRKLGAQY